VKQVHNKDVCLLYSAKGEDFVEQQPSQSNLSEQHIRTDKLNGVAPLGERPSSHQEVVSAARCAQTNPSHNKTYVYM